MLLPLPLKMQQVSVTNLLWATSFLQSLYKTDITFSLHKSDKFYFFCSFSINYVLRLVFSVDIESSCMVFTSLVFLKCYLTASFLNQVLASLIHFFELLLDWSSFVILNNPQNIPFPSIYVKHQIPASSEWDSFGSKIHLCWNLFFFGIFYKIRELVSVHFECTDSNYKFDAL